MTLLATDSESTQPASAERKQSTMGWVLETIVLVALAFALAQGVKTFLFQPFVIPSGSMIPTIQLWDRVIAEKVTYRFSNPPEAGDIVVFDNPLQNPPILIKRVIATGGQKVDLKDGAVYVDGKKLSEPYTHGEPSFPLNPAITYPFVVPNDAVWVMGDNRTNSGDSREMGAVPVSAVLGRAMWTYWPPKAFGPLE